MSEKYTTTPQIVSYGIGRQMGDQLASDPFDGLEPSAVAQGILDTLAGVESPISTDKIAEAFGIIQEEMKIKHADKAKVAAVVGEEYLALNAKKEGVITLESGLQYEILTQGTGDKPAVDATVSTHYHGTLIDGTIFDSSVDRGQPAEFPVNRVIPGWTEALQLMPVGSKWRLHIPYQLAYGEAGSGAKIAPYAALVFDVELLAIVS